MQLIINAKEKTSRLEDDEPLFTEVEIIRLNRIKRITELKQRLQETDYQAIKRFEGYLTDYEYEPIKTQRQAWRDEINELEKLI